MDEALLDRASDLAFKRLGELGGDPKALPEPLQTIVVIYAAQAVIDNGGLEYPFRHLSNAICGDQAVWEKLSDYVSRQRMAGEIE